MKKLSATQQAVVDKLASGWQLGVSKGFCSRAWIQFGKIGCGGRSEGISLATAKSLIDRGVVTQCDSSWAVAGYNLSAIGEDHETS